jgi:fumarate reductase flavoprotein subunit
MRKSVGKLCLGLAAAVLLSACQTASKPYSFVPGTYEGQADGFGGPVKLTVEVDAASIRNITIVENNETQGIGSIAIDQLPTRIISAQSLGIDGISGASVTSRAIVEAVKRALEHSGVDMARLTRAPGASRQRGAEKELSADLVIVGAGGAGLTAAISAAQQGLKVLVLEKMPYAGGATAMSGGGTTATGSRWQQEAGIKDDPEWLFMDMLRNGHFYNNPPTTWFYANKIGPSFDWLVSPDGAGVPYERQISGVTGEVVGGVNGDIYTSSTCVGWALASGYQAGLSIALKIRQTR